MSQSVNRLSLVGDHKLATANQTPWIDTWKVNSNTLKRFLLQCLEFKSGDVGVVKKK